MRKVIAAKYGIFCSGNKAGNHSMFSARSPWKVLSSLQTSVDQFVAATLGNGNTLAFWFDS